MATYYDAIYDCKPYEYEARCVSNLAYQYLRSPGRRLLDVACGTGRHVEHLKRDFETEGLDVSAEMLEVARQRNPDVTFHCGDMTDFRFGRSFDVIMCLFSSIGYLKTQDRLAQAIDCMAMHVAAGGILVIEPWYTPDNWRPGTVHSIFIDRPELKIARIAACSMERGMSIVDIHCLIGTPDRVHHRAEREELGLFAQEDIRSLMENAGLEVVFEAEGIGLTERGVFIGRRPLPMNPLS